MANTAINGKDHFGPYFIGLKFIAWCHLLQRENATGRIPFVLLCLTIWLYRKGTHILGRRQRNILSTALMNLVAIEIFLLLMCPALLSLWSLTQSLSIIIRPVPIHVWTELQPLIPTSLPLSLFSFLPLTLTLFYFSWLRYSQKAVM